jgi:hypothetical protein
MPGLQYGAFDECVRSDEASKFCTMRIPSLEGALSNVGVCVAQDANQSRLLSVALAASPVKASEWLPPPTVHCVEDTRDWPWNHSKEGRTVCTAVGVLVLLCLVCTVLDVRRSVDSESNPFASCAPGYLLPLLAFSLQKNLRSLTAPTRDVGVNLRSMHGMRTLGQVWIVFGHTMLWWADLDILNLNYYITTSRGSFGAFITTG